ncbi:MAG: hypothetical protein ABFQ53_02305, partial [Patescibacteria group bacterium]
DINVDGWKDVVGFGDGGIVVSYGVDGYSFDNQGTMIRDFGRLQGWQIDDSREIIDINGDGYPDISGWKDGVHWVSLSVEGTYFENAVQWH